MHSQTDKYPNLQFKRQPINLEAAMERIPLGSTFSMVANLASIELQNEELDITCCLENTKELYKKISEGILISNENQQSSLSSDPGMIFLLSKALINVDLFSDDCNNDMDSLLEYVHVEFLKKLKTAISEADKLNINEKKTLANICLALSKMTTNVDMDTFSHNKEEILA